jgi:hypothetical protein
MTLDYMQALEERVVNDEYYKRAINQLVLDIHTRNKAVG